jgi:hypothetical protein
MINLKFKFEVKQFKPKPDALAAHLVADPSAKRVVLGVAEDIAASARTHLGLSNAAPKGVVYAPLIGTGSGWKALKKGARNGTYFSAAPAAVGRDIKVKDATKVFHKRREIRVALVVADHPYSMAYEYGSMGIKSKRFLSRSAVGVAARHTWLFPKHGLKG